MKFDVIIGNPPYEKQLHMKIMLKMTELKPDIISMVVPAPWLTQQTRDTYRTSLFSFTTPKYIKILPIGTFQHFCGDSVQQVTCVITLQKDYNGPITIVRETNSCTLEYTNDDIKVGAPIYYYYGEYGKSIIDKMLKHQGTRFGDVMYWVSNKRGNPEKTLNAYPNRHDVDKFCHTPAYIHTDYVHVSKAHNSWETDGIHITSAPNYHQSNFGRKIQVGILTSDTPPTIKQLNYRRLIIPCKYPDEVCKYMSGHLYGILLSSLSVCRNINNYNVGLIPLIDIPNFTEEQAYQILGLSDTEINWLTRLKE